MLFAGLVVKILEEFITFFIMLRLQIQVSVYNSGIVFA